MSSESSRFQFRSFALTDVGLCRANLEDAYYFSDEKGLFIVSDGMGGAVAGKLAATITVQTLPLELNMELRHSSVNGSGAKAAALGRTINDVEALLLQKTRNQPAAKGLGATVVAGYYVGDGLMALSHLGDSRAYLLRDTVLECLTEDHTVANMLFQTGRITREELSHHPARHILTQYIGMLDCPEIEVLLLPLSPGDRLLFCSDGLTSMVSEQEIGQILQESDSREASAKALIAAANKGGGRDNITVIVIDISPGSPLKKWNGQVKVREVVGHSLLKSEDKTPEKLVEAR